MVDCIGYPISGIHKKTASASCAARADTQGQYVITRNIANNPGAIAARYELAHHRSVWAPDGMPMSPAVQQPLPDPDALTASDGQRYYRNMDGQWTSNGAPPDSPSGAFGGNSTSRYLTRAVCYA
nr:hypothetical protein [Xanthomonas arboricola]